MPNLILITLPAFITNLVSLVASLVLLIWVSRLKPRLARRLMARQIWHLALADVVASVMYIVFSGVGIIIEIGGHVPDVEDQGWLDGLCAFGVMFLPAMAMSSLFEVHIAFASVLTILRCPVALRIWAKTLPVMWLASIAFGAIFILKPTIWREDVGCSYSNSSNLLELVVLASTVVMCAASYFVCLFVACCHAGGAVQRQVWRQTHWFLAAAVIAWGPYLCLAFLTRNREGPQPRWALWPLAVAYGFRQTNGLCNAVVYASMSYFVRRTRRRSKTLAEATHPPGEALDPITQMTSLGVSWHVRLPSQAEVFAVQATTALANSNAAEEIAALGSQFGSDDSDAEDDFLACFDDVAEGSLENVGMETPLPTVNLETF